MCQSSAFGKMTPRSSGVLGGSWNRDYKRIMGIPFKDYICWRESHLTEGVNLRFHRVPHVWKPLVENYLQLGRRDPKP